MAGTEGFKPKVLCVDDEKQVVESFAALLRKDFEIHIATSGADALKKIREVRGLAVVVSDMRMPNMDGVKFLHEMSHRCPDATRIMLTGEAGADGAKRAINEGQVYRFLTKPCPINELRSAILAGVELHRLALAERAVLRETLIGCIRALVEVLSIANPVAFGRVSGIKRRVMELAARLGYPEFWQLEAAALLSQIGYLSMPTEVAERIPVGRPPSAKGHALASSAPEVAKKLFEHIPRLDAVMQILAAMNASDEEMAALGAGPVGIAARVLGAVLEADSLSAGGQTREQVLSSLRPHASRYGTRVVEELASLLVTHGEEEKTEEIRLRDIQPGMTILQDVRNHHGVLLVPRDFDVTPSFLHRITGFGSEVLDQRVRIVARQAV